jgi:hypothetical protein
MYIRSRVQPGNVLYTVYECVIPVAWTLDSSDNVNGRVAVTSSMYIFMCVRVCVCVCLSACVHTQGNMLSEKGRGVK